MGVSNDDQSSSCEDDSESEQDCGTSTVTNKDRKRKRRVTTESDSDDNLPENMLQVEENLCAIQLKNNMTDEGVKKILKKVVSNEHVLALVKLREEEEIEAEEAPTPKITRSKAKELWKGGDGVDSPAISWSLTPVKSIPLKTSPELTALISSQQLPEDESDDEYQPNDEEHVSDDDVDTLGTCSDVESQPRTPATPTTPASSLHDDATLSPTHFDDDGIFKIPKDIVKTPSKPAGESVTIARRTRSQLCLSATSIDQLEESFVPPDFVPSQPLDPLWKDFLTDITNPENQHHEEDDEADPDFNYAVAVEEILDADHQLEEERPVNISRKELNDLISELCDGYFEVPLVNLEPLGPALPPSDPALEGPLDHASTGPIGPATQGAVPVALHDAHNQNRSAEENHVILDISNSKPDLTIKCDDPELDITETQFAEMEVITAEERDKCENDIANGSAGRPASPAAPTGTDLSYFARVLGTKQDTVLNLKPRSATSEQADLADKVITVQLPRDCKTVMFAEQCDILCQQLRQHVQLATQFYIQLYGHPELWKQAPDFKQMLDELDAKAKGKEESYYRPCNLNDALELCSHWEEKLSVESEENLNMIKFIQEEVEKTRKRRRKCAVYIAKFPEQFMDVISRSKVFLYPYLLPPAPIRLDRCQNKKRDVYVDSELHLMAMGLEEFYEYAISNPKVQLRNNSRQFNFPLISTLITKYMLPMHKPHNLVSVYTNSRRKSSDNPITYYFRMGKTLPVVHTILPHYPNFTLMDYRPEELPIIWVRHVHKMCNQQAYQLMRIRPFAIKPRGRNINFVISTDPINESEEYCENDNDYTEDSEPPIKLKKTNSDVEIDRDKSDLNPTRLTRSAAKKLQEKPRKVETKKKRSRIANKQRKPVKLKAKDNYKTETEPAPAFQIVIPKYPDSTSILVPRVENGILVFSPQDCVQEIEALVTEAKEVDTSKTITTASCKTPIVSSELVGDNQTGATGQISGKWLSVRKNLIQVPVQSFAVPSPAVAVAPVTHTTISIDDADQEDSVFGINLNAENGNQRDSILAVLKKLADRATHAEDCECKCLLAKCVKSAARHNLLRGQKLISNYFEKVSTSVHKDRDNNNTLREDITEKSPAFKGHYHNRSPLRQRTDSEVTEIIEESSTESESVTTDRLENSTTPSPLQVQETINSHEHFFATSKLLLLLEVNKDALTNQHSRRIQVPDNFNIWLELKEKVTIFIEEMLPSMPVLQTTDSRDTHHEVLTGNKKEGKKLQNGTSENTKNTNTGLNVNRSQRPGRRKCKVIEDWNHDETITNTPEDLNEDYLVTAYFEKVQARFNTQSNINTCTDNQKFLEFQALLDNFSVEKSSPCDLFRNVEKLFGEGNADLSEEFLMFLTPGQAATVGRFMDHFMLTRMSEFIEGLQKYFAAKPASLRKVLKALERGLTGASAGAHVGANANVGAGLTTLRAAILPQLRGSTELTEGFLNFFSDERPAESVYDNEMVEVVTDSSWGEEVEDGQGVEVWEAGWAGVGEARAGGSCGCRHTPPTTTTTTTRRPPNGCLSCDLTYMEGGLVVQRGRALRPVSVSFPHSTHTHAQHAHRLATHPRSHAHTHNDSDDERTSPKRNVKPARTSIAKHKHKVVGGKLSKNTEKADVNIQRVCARSIIKEEIMPENTNRADAATKQSLRHSGESNADAHSVTDMRLVYEDDTDIDMDIEDTVIGREVAHRTDRVSQSDNIPENSRNTDSNISKNPTECAVGVPGSSHSLSSINDTTHEPNKKLTEWSKNVAHSGKYLADCNENETELSNNMFESSKNVTDSENVAECTENLTNLNRNSSEIDKNVTSMDVTESSDNEDLPDNLKDSGQNVGETSKNLVRARQNMTESCDDDTVDQQLPNASPLTSLKSEGTDWTREEDKTILQVLQCSSDPQNTFERIDELLPHRSLQEIRERFLNVMNLLQKMASGDVT